MWLISRIGPPSALSGDAFPWDSDVATAFESIYLSLDNQDRFEEGEGDWAPEERSDRLVLLFTDGDFLIVALRATPMGFSRALSPAS